MYGGNFTAFDFPRKLPDSIAGGIQNTTTYIRVYVLGNQQAITLSSQ